MANEPEFDNRIIEKPLTKDELEKMAKGHNGTIKLVADIQRERVAAGAKWHSGLRNLLVAEGSNPDDCWGAKIDINSGGIVYESQINKEKPQHNAVEIKDDAVRKKMKLFIERFFVP